MLRKRLILLVVVVATIIVGTSFVIPTKEIKVSKVEEAKRFCINHNFNSDICFFVDFSENSRSNRFKVYDIKNNKVLYTCKCMHGKGSSNQLGETTRNSFSNFKGSGKSSLGKYKIGKKRIIYSANGQFDVSKFKIPCFETYGLDKTNSNAHSRGILIHPYPDFLPLSWFSYGCFSIPYTDFDNISDYILKSSKPILLWAYYE